MQTMLCKNVSLILSVLGLFFDFWGFYGLYKTKQNQLKKVPKHGHRAKYITGNENPLNLIDKLAQSVNDSFDKFHKDYLQRERKSMKFFILVMIGFLLQVAAISFQFWSK